MYTAAPRLDSRLASAIAHLDDPGLPIAETYRRARDVADHLGLARPSYERVRLLIKEARREKARRRHKRDVLLDVALHLRPVEDLYSLLE